MKKIFIFLFVIFLLTAANAESTPLFRSFTALKTFKADFKQENRYQGLDSFSLEGSVYVVRGEKAVWDYSNPLEFYILTPEGVEHYSEELNQLLKISVNPENSNDPVSMLLAVFLDTSGIKGRFNVKEEGENVTLTPIKKQELKKIVFGFENGIIKNVITEDNSDNETEIYFFNVKYNEPVHENIFNKVIPEGTDIVEQTY